MEGGANLELNAEKSRYYLLRAVDGGFAPVSDSNNNIWHIILLLLFTIIIKNRVIIIKVYKKSKMNKFESLTSKFLSDEKN